MTFYEQQSAKSLEKATEALGHMGAEILRLKAQNISLVDALKGLRKVTDDGYGNFVDCWCPQLWWEIPWPEKPNSEHSKQCQAVSAAIAKAEGRTT